MLYKVAMTDKRRARRVREERKRLIWNMWLACYTQEEIAEATGMTRQAIDLEIETFANIGHVSDFCKSRSFAEIGHVSVFGKSRSFSNIGNVSDFTKSRSFSEIGNVSDFAKSLKT
jgi:hypothetical protein